MLNPDVTALLIDPDLGAQPITVLRNSESAWADGRRIASEPERLTAVGIVQPVSSEMLQMFPEGERREGMVAVYTAFEFRLTRGNALADEILWRGEKYKIIRADRWTDYGYNVAYAQKE